MSEIAKATSKKPVSKSENSGSQIRKIEPSQSINSPVDQILYLQRTVGNQAVQRLIKSGTLQAKLKIGQPGDKYEQEADWVAEQVMRMPEPKISGQEEDKEEEVQAKPLTKSITPLVHRESVPEEEEETAQAKGDGGNFPAVFPSVESGINTIRGGGSPLPESSRAFFDPLFSVDFRGVKVHTDSNAAHLARNVNAKAFTVGRDVVFGSGQFSPETTGGKKLLGHELTHVVQQNGGGGNENFVIQRWRIPLPGLWKAKQVPPGLRSLFRTTRSRSRIASKAFWIHFVNAYGPLKYPFHSIVKWVKYSPTTSKTAAGETVYDPSKKKSRIFMYPKAFSSVEYFWSVLSHEFIHALQYKRAAKLGIRKSLAMREFEAYLWNLENCKITGTIYNSAHIADFMLEMKINYVKVPKRIKQSRYWNKLSYSLRYRLINDWYSRKYTSWVGKGRLGSSPPAPPKVYIYIPSGIKRRLRY